MPSNAASTETPDLWSEVAALIGYCSLSLDDERFDDFLALCAASFRYRVQVYAPELRREMIWLDQDREEFSAMTANLDRHFRKQEEISRHPVLLSVSEKDGALETVAAFSAYLTDRNGTSRLYAVGRYADTLVREAGELKLTRRDVILTTRDLGPGSHVPL